MNRRAKIIRALLTILIVTEIVLNGDAMASSKKIKSIHLNLKKATVYVGDKTKLKATIKPANVHNKKIKWKSSNNRLAKVNKKGLVTFKKTGKVTITATSYVKAVKAKCKFTIKKTNTKHKATSISTSTIPATQTLAVTATPLPTLNMHVYGNSSGNSTSGGKCIEKDGFLYYSESDVIYKQSVSTGQRSVLVNDDATSLNCIGNFLIYNVLNTSTNKFSLIKIGIDGFGRTVLPQANAYIIGVSDWYIYYNDSIGCYRCGIDGSNPVCISHDNMAWSTVYENNIYYSIKGDSSIYTIGTDGTNKKIIANSSAVQANQISASYFQVYNGMLYYWDMIQKTFYRMNLDGTGRTIIHTDTESCICFNVSSLGIMFLRLTNNSMQICKMDLDGKSFTIIYSPSVFMAFGLDVIGNNIYFSSLENYDMKPLRYIPTLGGNPQNVFGSTNSSPSPIINTPSKTTILCPYCNGQGYTKCSLCHGTGLYYNASKGYDTICPSCYGSISGPGKNPCIVCGADGIIEY